MAVLQSASGLGASYVRRHYQRGWVVCKMKIVITGSSGAISSTGSKYDHPDLTATYKSSAGVYDITYPPCIDAFFDFEIVSATLAAGSVVVTAKSPTAGTATIKLCAGVTPANLADTEYFTVRFSLLSESQT